jgi:phospholipase/carboxylesterase
VSQLEHVLREPAGDPAGALILNHGRATDQHDLAPFLDFLDPEKKLLGICPGGPFTNQPPGGRHWYAVKEIGYPDEETFAEGYGALSGFLDDLLAEREIEWQKTVVGGFSQGAVMSYSLGLGTGRPKPAGILAMSGFIPTVPGVWEADLASRKDLPVMIAHGELDPVISVDFGRTARDLLTEAGLDVTYRESRMPHTIDPRVVPEIQKWVAGRFSE